MAPAIPFADLPFDLAQSEAPAFDLDHVEVMAQTIEVCGCQRGVDSKHLASPRNGLVRRKGHATARVMVLDRLVGQAGGSAIDRLLAKPAGNQMRTLVSRPT